MRVLVTGADGFVGRHAVAAFRSAGHEVFLANGPGAKEHPLTLTDAALVRACVEASKPEGVLHLAGVSSVAASHQDPAQAFDVNVTGTVHLLEALRRTVPSARLVYVSSGEVYGGLLEPKCASEQEPLLAKSPYAASKMAAEVAVTQFRQSYGLHAVIARPFNHLGAGQAPSFVVPSFARQLSAIGKKEQPPVLKVGNLEPVRDFSHVADVVEAYRLLLNSGASGESYNICSGEPRHIREILDELIRLSNVPAKVEVDPARLRPAEIPWLVGSAAKLEGLGWKRKRSTAQALEDVLAEVARS
jgi:GDP-4-dehydro-6-deoxy-D-mannose reductase